MFKLDKNFLNVTNIKARDYSKIYLKQNPFPLSLIPSEIPIFTADRDKEREHFEKILGDLIDHDESSITVLKGDYGSGKTHLLRTLKNFINSNLLNHDNGVLAIYVRSPGRTIADFYREVIEDLGRARLESFALKILKDYLEKNLENSKKYIYDDNLKDDPIKKLTSDKDKFIEGIMIHDMFDDLSIKMFRNLKNNEPLMALLYLLLDSSISTHAWKWLLGIKLSREDLKRMPMLKNIENDGAYNIFKNLIDIFSTTGIKHTVILVDEFEKLSLLPSNVRNSYQDDLRHLIDDFPTNMCITFAITPFYWDVLIKESTALIRRISSHELVLEFFKEQQMKDLIKQYLEYSRMTNMPNHDRIHDCQNKLYPFSDEALSKIFTITGGSSSKILELCRKCIEHIIKNNDVKVTLDVIDEIIK